MAMQWLSLKKYIVFLFVFFCVPSVVFSVDDNTKSTKNDQSNNDKSVNDNKPKEDLGDLIARGALSKAGYFNRKKNIGTLIAESIAGPNCRIDDCDEINSISKGVEIGLMVGSATAVGEVLREKIKGATRYTLGGTIDYLFNKCVDFWDDVCCMLWHDSVEPFRIENLRAWQESIKDSFEDLEKMMKDGLKDSLRGHDMTLRQFEVVDSLKTGDKVTGDALSPVNQDLQQSDAVDDSVVQTTPWADFVEGYVELFERCINEIDKRKGYYKEDSDEIFLAEQLKKRLIKFGNVLLRSQSIKDFDALLESNKALIPAIKKRIDNIFKRLIESIKPRTLSLGDANDSGLHRETKTVKKRESDDEGRGFPYQYTTY